MDARFFLVLVCFLLSGFAGLLYQTAWTRSFSFVFGTSNLAVATVLAAYMGGLSLGAALAARWLHRVRRPVLTYGLLELGVALAALAVPFAIRASSALHVALFGGQPTLPGEGGSASALFYLAAAFVILGVPTTLMGATLPLLARHAVREESQIGSRVGLLYAVNTAGAIAGTLATAYLLLPQLGLRGAILAGAGLNACVFALAAVLARGAGVAEASAAAVHAQRPGDAPARRVLTIAFATSVASFTAEVLWTRLLEHVLGGSIFAFATMLASFLVGIALGGALASRLATTSARSVRGLAFAELGVGLFSIGAYLLIDRTPGWAAAVTLSGTAGALARAAIGGALLLPSTLCIGATFPFLVRAFTSDPAAAGWASARVYAWNTLGAIVGSVSAGFWTIPLLSFSGALAAAATLSFALALLACTLLEPRERALAALAGAAALAAALAPLPTPWRLLQTSPINLAATPPEAKPPYFYAVGRSASVLLMEAPGEWALRTNGLPEATIEAKGAHGGHYLLARWMSALPALAGAKRELVIGLGGGIVVERVPPTVDSVDVVEIEEEVLRANQVLAPLRAADPLADPRLRVHLNDARGALALTVQRWDAIVSQPSHPWTAGASHLYTRDFFAEVRDHLDEGGLFVQWMGLQFVDPALLRTLVATLLDVFPHVQLYQPQSGGILFVASTAPLDFAAPVERAVAQAPEAFARLGVRVPEDVIAALTLDEAGARSFAAGAEVSSDDENLFATRSPRAMSRAIDSTAKLFAPYDPLLRGKSPGDAAYLARRLAQTGQPARALSFARRLEGLSRDLALGEIALARDERGKAAGFFGRALAADPASQSARFRYVEARRAELIGGDAAVAEVAAGLDGLGATVVRGWRLAASGDWEALAALDAELAPREARHVANDAAARLRADWRLASGDAAAAAEALALIDEDPYGWDAERFTRRALAGANAGDAAAAAESLRLLADPRLGVRRLAPGGAARVARALAKLPADALDAGTRARLAKLAPGALAGS